MTPVPRGRGQRRGVQPIWRRADGAGAFCAGADNRALARPSGPETQPDSRSGRRRGQRHRAGHRHQEHRQGPGGPPAGHALAPGLVTGDELTALRGAHGDLQGKQRRIVVIAHGRHRIAARIRGGGRETPLRRLGLAAGIRSGLPPATSGADALPAPLENGRWDRAANPPCGRRSAGLSPSPGLCPDHQALAVDPKLGAAGFCRLRAGR